jgi:hypothetical protein
MTTLDRRVGIGHGGSGGRALCGGPAWLQGGAVWPRVDAPSDSDDSDEPHPGAHGIG